MGPFAVWMTPTRAEEFDVRVLISNFRGESNLIRRDDGVERIFENWL